MNYIVRYSPDGIVQVHRTADSWGLPSWDSPWSLNANDIAQAMAQAVLIANTDRRSERTKSQVNCKSALPKSLRQVQPDVDDFPPSAIEFPVGFQALEMDEDSSLAGLPKCFHALEMD